MCKLTAWSFKETDWMKLDRKRRGQLFCSILLVVETTSTDLRPWICQQPFIWEKSNGLFNYFWEHRKGPWTKISQAKLGCFDRFTHCDNLCHVEGHHAVFGCSSEPPFQLVFMWINLALIGSLWHQALTSIAKSHELECEVTEAAACSASWGPCFGRVPVMPHDYLSLSYSQHFLTTCFCLPHWGCAVPDECIIFFY
jgi:hypothetical protein